MATYAYRCIFLLCIRGRKKKKTWKKLPLLAVDKTCCTYHWKKKKPQKTLNGAGKWACLPQVRLQTNWDTLHQQKEKKKKKTLKTFYIIGKKTHTKRMLEKVLALVETCWITMSKFSVWDTLETRFAFQKSNVSHCTTFVGNIFPGNQLFFSQCTKQHQTNKFSSDSIGR